MSHKLPLPADVIGYMSALGGTLEPLDMCASCQRALLYGGLLYAGAAGAALADARKKLEDRPLGLVAAGAAVVDAGTYLDNVIRTLLEVAKADFAGACKLADEMTDEDYGVAMTSFFQARTEHYTDGETGRIVFEPHDEGGERGDLAPAGA